jgi:hypothetical protein
VRVLTGNLVLVEWLDSHHRPGWTTDDPASDPLVCKSVGWLIRQTKEALVLSANVTEEEQQQRCGDMTIPQRCVRRIKQLRS